MAVEFEVALVDRLKVEASAERGLLALSFETNSFRIKEDGRDRGKALPTREADSIATTLTNEILDFPSFI